MATISLVLDDNLLLALLQKAQAAGLNIDQLIGNMLAVSIQQAPKTESQQTVQEPLQKAMDRARGMVPQELFTLNTARKGMRAIFAPEEWSDMQQHQNMKPNIFGKEFREAVEREGVAVVEGKTKDNKQIYKRK